MKTTGLYILGSITLVLVGALAVYEHRKKNQPMRFSAPVMTDGVDSPALKKFRGFDFDLFLNSNTKRGEAEITALQRMINAYYDGGQFIDVTGKFDTQTRNALRDITNKTSTTMADFQASYLAKKRGQKVANDLIASMTITGK